MILQRRISLMVQLGRYMRSDDESWSEIKAKASQVNSWFIPGFIKIAVDNICEQYLDESRLLSWVKQYDPGATDQPARKIGLVMAGNIPLAGFHDMLCVFVGGHTALMKPSSKDEIMIKHLVEKLVEWDNEASNYLQFAERLNNCDAYIATGSNNTSRYFKFYFGKYPHIIRHNRSSVAILTGNESPSELSLLADDICLYFGLGCRNVTKIFVPENYDFLPLLESLKKYDYLCDHHKYKNNYDYNLAIHILNKKFYMTNDSTLIVENPSVFSPISQLHFEYYRDESRVLAELRASEQVQCIVGTKALRFGQAQKPRISDYADGVDTMAFLKSLNS